MKFRYFLSTLALLATSSGMMQAQPLSPPQTISIVDAGAIGDGETLNTEKIQSAIDRLAAKSGGTLVIPKGVFISGALFSNRV